jgi:hypothetical protein
MEIFIGSSKEAIKVVDQIAVWIEEARHTALPWNEPGLFPPGEHTLQTLIGISKRVHAAILLFTDDDDVWYRGDAAKQPRDNVLIEYGLFVGALDPYRAIICRSGTQQKTASDLAGINSIDITTKYRGKQDLRLWLEGLAGRSAKQEQGGSKAPAVVEAVRRSQEASAAPVVPVRQSAPKVKLFYTCRGTQSNQASFVVTLENTLPVSISLGDLTLRYWYAEELSLQQAVQVDYAKLGAENVTAVIRRVTPTRPGANSYVEIGFKKETGVLAGFSDTGEIQMRLHNDSFIPLKQTEHYSFDPREVGKAVESKRVTVYVKGALVWGIEPGT